jgi:hypothetical protein
MLIKLLQFVGSFLSRNIVIKYGYLSRANADQFVKTLDEVLEWIEREQPHIKQQPKHKG